VAVALHRLTPGQLYAVALAAGVCAVFFDVSEQSYVPSVLDSEDLTEGFGKLGASASLAQVSVFLVYFSPLRRVRDVSDL
jgi:hypothetical protein